MHSRAVQVVMWRRLMLNVFLVFWAMKTDRVYHYQATFLNDTWLWADGLIYWKIGWLTNGAHSGDCFLRTCSRNDQFSMQSINRSINQPINWSNNRSRQPAIQSINEKTFVYQLLMQPIDLRMWRINQFMRSQLFGHAMCVCVRFAYLRRSLPFNTSVWCLWCSGNI